ncbi:MAG: O-antigen ligase family protein [Gemmataceae bacterium]
MSVPPPPASQGAETLRRMLIGSVTALIVARPLVLGEDPGLLYPFTDGSNLVLALLWFMTAIGWAAWRVWTAQRSWRGSLVEAGLVAAVLFVFVSAFTAAYQHPAFLIAWEWLALLLAFCMVRQLSRGAGDDQRWLAAIVAGGIALSAHALYQQTELSDRAAHEELLRASPLTELERQQFLNRLAQGVFATYAHPNSFASYLALTIPALVGWLVVARWRGQVWWKQAALAVSVLVMLAALTLTKSRGAILGLGLALLVIGVLNVRVPMGLRRLFGIAAALVVLAGITVLFGGASSAGDGMPMGDAVERRLEYWGNSWEMLTDEQQPQRLWLGVGPGNFGLAYPQYMSPADLEEVKDPHNFAIEMWTSSGLFALLALLFALAALCWHCWPVLRGEAEDPAAEAEPAPTARRRPPPTQWEFYIGGMAGISLGFLLWGWSITDKNMLIIGAVTAGVRSIIWFASFALLESIPWRSNGRGLAILTGVLATLVNLTISGGISFPSVALPLWVMAALALNARPWDCVLDSRFKLFALVPLPLAIAGLFLYVSFVFFPVQVSQYGMQQVRLYAPAYEQLRTSALTDPPGDKNEARIKALQFAQKYLTQRIINPLEEAVKTDPGDAQARLALAHWYEELWDLMHHFDLATQRAVDRAPIRYRAIDQAKRAREANPYDVGGDLLIYQIYHSLAPRSPEKQQCYQLAAEAMARLTERDPSNPLWRLRLADALFMSESNVEAGRQAEQALQLNEQVRQPLRKLTPQQVGEAEYLIKQAESDKQ